jgi:hypothetical protein
MFAASQQVNQGMLPMAYRDNEIEALNSLHGGYERDDVPVQPKFNFFSYFRAAQRHGKLLLPGLLIGHE